MQDIAEDLRRAVNDALPALRAIDEQASARAPAPGKWCPREVLGHLIDSASNNHQRFVRVRFQDDLVFEGYDQDAWVAAQRYREASWAELIELCGTRSRACHARDEGPSRHVLDGHRRQRHRGHRLRIRTSELNGATRWPATTSGSSAST